MTEPVRSEPAVPGISAVTALTELYCVTLVDGTVLWVPMNEANRDCSELAQWAEENNVEL